MKPVPDVSWGILCWELAVKVPIEYINEPRPGQQRNI